MRTFGKIVSIILIVLYVIMIPLIGVFIRKKSDWKIWTASFVSAAGAFLLCADSSMKQFGNIGDLLMLLCAVCFAFQFIFLAKFAPAEDALLLAAVQFFTVAVISGVAALISGEQSAEEEKEVETKVLEALNYSEKELKKKTSI